MEKILSEKIKEFKEKENREFEKIKQEYDIKIKSFKDKYKELEEKEFSYLENEYNKTKEKMQAEYSTKISSLENKLKSNHDVLKKEEEDLKKRLEMIDQRRRNFDLEWNKLNDEEKRIDSKKENVLSKILTTKSSQDTIENNNSASSYKNDEIKMKYEIEKLKIEKSDLETKLQSMQKLLDKFYAYDPSENNSKHSKLNNSNVENNSHNNFINENNDTDTEDSSKNSEQLISKIKALNNQSLSNNNFKDSDDDSEINELVEHAKLKLKLKYYGAKKKAQFDLSNKSDTVDSDLYDSSNENLNPKLGDYHANNTSENLNHEVSDSKKYLIDNLSKEKDALEMANELIDKYKQNLIKRRVKLEKAQQDLKKDETSMKQMNPLKLEDRRLFLEKEELDLEQLGLNIKTGKRLIKQKRFQLNLLENNLKENGTDSDFSNNENENDDEEKLFSFKNNTNLNDLIQSLKMSQTKNELKGLYEQKIHPILKKIPKLNNNLELMFDSINSSLINAVGSNKGLQSYKNLKNFNEDSNFIDEKWRKYLGESQHSNRKVNYFQSTIDTDGLDLFRNENNFLNRKVNSFDNSKIINGPWENSPAYHKLTLESGTRLLEEKWNKYMGNQSNVSPNNNINFSKTLTAMPSTRSISSYDNRFSSSTTITLPEQTKQRLKNHMDWLKKFKADGETNFLNDK